MTETRLDDWLSRYANDFHAWQLSYKNGKKVYTRPLGLVESSFDLDGTDYEGRADMNALLTLEIRHSFQSKDELRKRIVLAFASLRIHHTMLMSKVFEDQLSGMRKFAVEVEETMEAVIEETEKHIVWIDDYYDEKDGAELHRHCQNVARIIDPSIMMSRLHVLPLVRLPNGNFRLQCLLILAHQISDGLSSYNWFNHFIRILNMPAFMIEQEIESSKSGESLALRLPPAQEDLYPAIVGSKARQRWFWAIIRVLRHVKKTLPLSFVNPLRRETRLPEAIPLPPKFGKLFDYSKTRRPPMNSFHCSTSLSADASNQLIKLCRSINVSVGAGCFALVGIAMMELHEQRHPNIPLAERKPFIASFPLNPRAFFGWNTSADSCMLAFSDGIVMPFLPSSLPIESRIKLIARQANRQLKQYQKRVNTTVGNVGLSNHSPARLLANGYLYAIERIEAKKPAQSSKGLNPQGAYPASLNMAGATCGVSSVGSTAAFFKPGMFDIDNPEGKDFVADFRALRMGVRARDNEFLVGSSTDADGIVGFGVSYDGNAISEEAANMWAGKMRALLEGEKRDSKL